MKNVNLNRTYLLVITFGGNMSSENDRAESERWVNGEPQSDVDLRLSVCVCVCVRKLTKCQTGSWQAARKQAPVFESS